jgi:hypothetical protein
MQAFQKQIQTLEGADTQVLGVSIDSPPANHAWAQQIGVTFPLLSDLGGDVMREYGVFEPKYKAARRVTYLIDKDGKVVEMQKDREAIDPTSVVASCERRKLKTYSSPACSPFQLWSFGRRHHARSPPLFAFFNWIGRNCRPAVFIG